MANLPEMAIYDMKYWNFEFNNGINDYWYISHIVTIHNNYNPS